MSGIKEFVEELNKEISRSLASSARAYFNNGIELFHKLRSQSYLEFQPAVGVLSIAVELLLKAVIAKKAFRHLYSNIPVEAQLLLTYPDSLPQGFNPRQFSNELKSFTFNAIEFNHAVSLFYQFFPEKRQEFKPYLSLVSGVRNISVHGALPSFQRYDLERIAYIAVNIFAFINDQNALDCFWLHLDQNTTRFIEKYKEDRIKRVERAIEDAKAKSKKIGHLDSYILSPDDKWESMVMQCPVCGSDAWVDGYTEQDGSGADASLFFHCDYFVCEECGLEFNDVEEMELAGLETTHDRTDELEDWWIAVHS